MATNGCAASWQAVPIRVPQGLILGPLLFVAYIYDNCADIICTAKKSASDTELYSHIFLTDVKLQGVLQVST